MLGDLIITDLIGIIKNNERSLLPDSRCSYLECLHFLVLPRGYFSFALTNLRESLDIIQPLNYDFTHKAYYFTRLLDI